MSGFGAAALAAPKFKKKAKGRTFDCGSYGKLTAKEIAALTGMSREGVWQRVRHGVKGDALCAPKHDSKRQAKEKCSKPVVLIAVKLARAFPHKVPSLKEIQAAHPMCERNAMRWRQAFTDADSGRVA
jgi:hypothetical protein